MSQISLYRISVPLFVRGLENLRNIVSKAESFGAAKKVDESVVLQLRLAIDQFPFVRQVQIACDSAKNTTARLCGVEPPKFEDNEKTFAELRARIDKTLEYIRGFREEQFGESKTRPIPIYFLPGKHLPGEEFLIDLTLPNFFFHVTTAYDILRHNGLDLGKGDYIGDLNFRDSK